MQPDPGSFSDIADDLIDSDGDTLSGLDLLRRAASEKVQRDERIEWPVPNRPGFKVRYTVEGLNPARMQSILKAAQNKKTGEIHGDTSNCLVLAHQCAGLVIDDEVATEDGRPLRFGDKAVLGLFGVDKAADAVRVFYGGPQKEYGFAIQQHANKLLRAAGMGDIEEDEEEDPTTGPIT